jgi:large subunit ribosomal protein L29
MNTTELRGKSVGELEAIGDEFRRRLFELRFKHHTGLLSNTADLKDARRTVARIETILRERKLAQAAAN